MYKFMTSAVTSMLLISLFLINPVSVSAHHWKYDKSWSAVNSTWWNGCTGLGSLSHNKNIWLDYVGGDFGYIFIHDHEVWANTTYEVAYDYDVTIMRALHYYDESNNRIGGVGDQEWSYAMEHTVLMSPNWTYTYGHSDNQVWGELNEDVRLEYDTAARISTNCEGFNTVFLGSFATQSDIIRNSSSLTSNSTEKLQIQSESIKAGIDLKNKIMASSQEKEIVINYIDNNIGNTAGNDVLTVNDERIDKWIERLAIDAIIFNKIDVDYSDIIKNAAFNTLRQDAVLLLANNYNVGINDSELKNYIENEKTRILSTDSGREVVKEVIEGLGLHSVEGLFYEYDLDHHINNYIWTKIKPIYEINNPMQENEDSLAYNRRLLNIYHNDIREIMNSYSIRVS